jgi:tRNA-splicing endonuclease subunit Sen34
VCSLALCLLILNGHVSLIELAVLIDDSPSHGVPTLAQLQAYDAARTESARQQVARLEAKEAAGISRDMSEAALQKRREREEKRKVKAPPKIPSSDKHVYNISISASSESLEWYNTAGNVYTTIAAAKEAGIWSYPATLHERALCGVFKSLWEQGLYMGGGIKFGGDFLVYPGLAFLACAARFVNKTLCYSILGDPLRYHSHFSAIVIDSPISVLRPMEIVAYGRLGTGTKKSHLLCGWDDENQDVTYYSIEWAGFG